MLIPIGQEDSIVRRQPWVSYGLLAANVPGLKQSFESVMKLRMGAGR